MCNVLVVYNKILNNYTYNLALKSPENDKLEIFNTLVSNIFTKSLIAF